MISYKQKLQESTRPFSGINIVPFTDIILVLLIIFMISAPGLIQSGLGIELPKSVNKDQGKKNNIIININSKNEIFLDDLSKKTKMSKKELNDYLKNIKDENKEVLINADQNVKHGEIISILDILKTNGIVKIIVGTQNVTE